jgi:hypothetical protein
MVQASSTAKFKHMAEEGAIRRVTPKIGIKTRRDKKGSM